MAQQADSTTPRTTQTADAAPVPAPHPDPLLRYARQLLLPGFGSDAQHALARARVTILGCGALGTVAAESLVRAGVGSVRIVDRDLVDLTNLHRQTLFTQRDADDAAPKAAAAADRLRLINPQVNVEPIVADATPRTIEALVADVQAVVDATDNFQTRYLLNDACVMHAVPLVYGGAIATRGMAMTILPRSARTPSPWPPTPCLRCVFPTPPAPGSTPTCDTAGVLNTVTGIVANVQATETLKILLKRWDLVSRTLLEFDPWFGLRRRVDLSTFLDPDCPCCAHRRFDHLDAPPDSSSALCGQNAIQLPPSDGALQRINLADLADRLAPVARPGSVRRSPHLVRASLPTPRGERELTLFADGRAIIKGTTDPAEARAIFARYVGV
ncbi:MAG: ThiF family adenylyltransferase [Phycisphaeraceae bacterium]|nr:ThiF family adenylyltransferase [Phycisphaeraceae bacterium]